MSEVLRLKKEAIKRGFVCDNYLERWDKAQTKRDLLDMVLDPNGAEFLCEGMAAGWGVTPQFMREYFKGYINGEYIRRKGGYTSELYVGAKYLIPIKSTLTLLIDCHSEVIVPKKRIARIFITAGSDIKLTLEGVAELYYFGDNKVEITLKEKGAFEEHHIMLRK